MQFIVNLKEVSHVLYSWVARHISRQKPCQIEIKFYLTPLSRRKQWYLYNKQTLKIKIYTVQIFSYWNERDKSKIEYRKNERPTTETKYSFSNRPDLYSKPLPVHISGGYNLTRVLSVIHDFERKVTTTLSLPLNEWKCRRLQI